MQINVKEAIKYYTKASKKGVSDDEKAKGVISTHYTKASKTVLRTLKQDLMLKNRNQLT